MRATQGVHECGGTFHVADPAIVERVALYLERVEAQAPNRFQLVGTAFHEHGCGRPINDDAEVVWSSSDESVACIAPFGVVLGQKDGDARISIEFKGCSTHLDVHIEDGVLAVFGQEPVYLPNAFARVGVTTAIIPSFWATVRDWRPRAGAVALSAAPPEVAELVHVRGDTDSWTLRGLRAGTATITVRLGTLQARRTIEVREARNPRFGRIDVEVADDRSSLSLLFIGQESEVFVGLEDDGGSIDGCEDLAWSSSAPEVLSVNCNDKDGLKVKALSEGNATLRVECKPLGVSQERALRVAEEPKIEWF